MTHPERLGKYQVIGVLGEGAMGVVYKGFDPDIQRVVALKTIRRLEGQGEVDSGQRSAARFRNEAKAAGRLLHPGIVGVYDFGDDGQVAYIAMEFVPGHTLSRYLAQRVPFGASDIASVMVQLLDALGHAHENGVWHRDVKPSNLIVMHTGRVKIADFGIARTDTGDRTLANSVLGTPMYMAPEHFMGRQIDHRVDIYAAGVVLYQLLTGRAPFVGTPEATMYQAVHDRPLAPSAVDGGSGLAMFDGVVANALAKDPAQRFPHAAGFRDAILSALGSVPPGLLSQAVVHALPVAEKTTPGVRPDMVSAPPLTLPSAAPSSGADFAPDPLS